MKYLILTSILFFRVSSLLAFDQFDLHAGDILLISFNCYECRVIESETSSSFSHSGVVLKNEKAEVQVAQALGSVGLFSLEQFLKNRTPGTAVSVYRPKEFLNLDQSVNDELEKKMLDTFKTDFRGAPFDHQYLWNNFDKEGREYLYCSEFVAKFLDRFLSKVTIPFPLTYQKNAAYWFMYFRGNIPEGALGNSPASFSRDDRFVFLGNL